MHEKKNVKNKIENWVTENPIMVDCQDSLATAIEKMSQRSIGALLVVEEGTLRGIFTERDLIKLLVDIRSNGWEESSTRTMDQVMTMDPVTAQAGDDYNTVYMKMKTHNIRHIPIMAGKELAGIVSIRDMVHFYQNSLETAIRDAQGEIDDLKEIIGHSSNDELNQLFQKIAEYKELSLTDHLTGLYNKRYFQTRFVEEIARAKRYKTDLSLIFCDIDFFKRINDSYGHNCGDEVLQEMARLLASSVDELHIISRFRKSDIVARYGGEEFVVILPETNKAGAAIAAEKMRETIEAHPFHVSNEEIQLTMSFGVAAFSGIAQNSTDIVKQADHAMYEAKNSGRNKVVVYS